MRLLGLLMGMALGIVQGYAFSPLYDSAVRLSLEWGRRLCTGPSKEVDPESPKAFVILFVSIIILCLAVLALSILPVTVLVLLAPEFRRTGFFPVWILMFIVGVVIFLQRLKRQNRFR